MMPYEKEAERLCKAIKKLAESEDKLRNFECYLGYCFNTWMDSLIHTPEDMAQEFEWFAEMEVQ